MWQESVGRRFKSYRDHKNNFKMKKVMQQLKKSNVVFDEVSHTYHLGGKKLQGITSLIRKHIFPDKFSGVPQAVLDARAEYGHNFHKEMELYINTGIESSSDAFNVFRENYKDGIRFIASEYIVTDNEDFASPIDAVGDDFTLYDFKTSSGKDVDYWRWQLSVYKYLFEMQNGFSPKALKVIWINKDMKHDIVELQPIDGEVISALLQAERDGVLFSPPKNVEVDMTQIVSMERIDAVAKLEQEICRRKEELKSIETGYDKLKKDILDAMVGNGITKWETDTMSITVKAPYERSSVDSAKLKKDYPDIYAGCLKTSMVKESLIVKLK